MKKRFRRKLHPYYLWLRFRFRAERFLRKLFGRHKTTYVWARVPLYRKMWRAAATELGAEFVDLSDDVWEVRYQGRSTRIKNYCVQLDDPVTLQIAGDKGLTYQLLERRGLPVPAHAIFTLDELAPMRVFIAQHRGPFVVKPLDSTSSGIGVTTHLHSFAACRRAAVLASLHGAKILIEQFIAGETSRLLFLNGEMLFASRRRGIRVIGDGASTIAELVSAVSRQRVAGGRAPISRDEDYVATLACQRLSEGTVPSSGQVVLVKAVEAPMTDTVELRTVYDEDITELVGDALRQEARAAVEALASEFCGVDIITVDPTRSLRDTGGVIGEVNTTPGLHHHYDIDKTDPDRPAAQIILRRLLDIDREDRSALRTTG